MKGNTAYEFEIFGYYIRICHLISDYWKYKPWKRISWRKL